jgi:hypothetical protein
MAVIAPAQGAVMLRVIGEDPPRKGEVDLRRVRHLA